MRRRLFVLAALLLAARDLRAQESPTIELSSRPIPRSFKADWHMNRARDLRYAGRLDEALVALDSALLSDPSTRGAHTMRALILAERHDQAGTLAALRQAHAVGDTLAYAAAMQVGTAQYRAASTTKQPAAYAQALATLQLADSIAATTAQHAVPRLLVAATALALANGELAAPGALPACSGIGTAREHMRLATTNLDAATGAPPAQVAQVRGALAALSTFTELQARQLRCA